MRHVAYRRIVFGLIGGWLLVGQAAYAALRAGAYAQDITPETFPVIVNGNFTEVIATKANDRLHARAIVLEDGATTVAIVVVDSCMLPRELLDEAKARAGKLTNIPADRILISATHTHTAPSAMGCLGSDADANYVKVLPDLLARAIAEAQRRLAPARIGHAVVYDAEHTATRRWVFRPDRVRNDPFGQPTVRANMHPGYLSPDAIGPTGPIDPGLSIVSVQHADGRPLAVLANYSMHYVGTTPLSADYYGRFAEKIGKLLGGGEDFVGIMSQGTSGDAWLADYSRPQPATKPTIETFSDAIAAEAAEACKGIRYTDDAPIAMKESRLTLRRRVPDERRLAWARERVAALGDKKPKAQPDIYAREAIFLHDEPERELKLQAIRIGDLAMAAIPNEVYALTGLKIKAQSPLSATFTVSLANGSEGYIPPPEQHKLGGYTTWPARTAALEEGAEPKITEAVVGLLEAVTGKPRRKMGEAVGDVARRASAAGAVAYYPMADAGGPRCEDASGRGNHGTYEDGVLFYLDGAQAAGATADPLTRNRAAHFAGGRMRVDARAVPASYSVAFSFWNGLAHEARPITAYLFSRGRDGDREAAGDHVGIGGSYDPVSQGKLIFFSGNASNQLITGRTPLAPRTWHRVVLVRNGRDVTVYLNGRVEISGQVDPAFGEASPLFFGGRCDNFANLEGKLDDVAVFDRPLAGEVVASDVGVLDIPQPGRAENPTRPAEAKPAEPNGTGGIRPGAMKRSAEPRTPSGTLESLHLGKGLTADLVAAEPLVSSPVAIDWGLDGGLWVVEMLDYPYGMDGKGKPGGRINYLTRSKPDGPYDRGTVFLEGLRMPTGILAWRKGVLITAAPDVIYAEDTDGDGQADKTEVLFTGFKPGNPQLRVNGLRYGLDNWVYLANGWSAGVVKSAKTGKYLDLKGHDLRIRPDTGEMELVSGVSQFGREHDDFGRWFGTDNAHPLFHYRLDDAYLRRNPQVTYPDVKTQLLPLPLPPVFPRSPFARRFIGLDHHGHFTSACGINLYRDELLFPRDERIHALICEPVHNLVQHQVLTADGVTFKAARVDGEAGADFIAGEDPWFRPVMTRTGPDGAVWVVDMYRYMIEHPDWLNDEGKKALAPFYRDGSDRGRIYRVYPKQSPPRPAARMDQMTTGQLVAAMGSPSGYVRDRAQMMLVWKRDPAAVESLEAMLTTSRNPLARLHALCTLGEISDLKGEILDRAMADADPAVRANALRLAEGRFAKSPGLLAGAAKLVSDASPFVRQQLARSLGQSDDPRAGAALAALAKSNGAELWPDVLSSGATHYEALVEAAADRAAPIAPVLFEHVVEMSAARGDRPALANLIGRALPPDGAEPSAERANALAAFLQTLARGGRTLADWSLPVDPLSRQLEALRPYFDTARRAAGDATLSVENRQAHAQLLGYLPSRADEDLNAVGTLLVPQTPTAVSTALVRAAARTGAPGVPAALLRHWASHSPDLRGQIADTLLPREPWALALAQSPAAKDLDFSRRQRLLNHASFKVKDAAKATFAQAALNLDRQKVIDSYAPALTAAGDRRRGEAMFAEHCATCHRVGTAPVGHDIGPNLLTVRDWPRENLLAAILDPDRTVEPRYFVYTATMTDGTIYTGLLTADTSAGVTIKTLDDADHVLPRANLKSLASTNHSLMPQGFEAAMTVDDLADLMAFIQQPTQAK